MKRRSLVLALTSFARHGWATFFLWAAVTTSSFAEAEVEAILTAYKNAATPHAKEAALKQLLNNYDAYKHQVAQKLESGAMNTEFKSLAREVDEKIVEMTQQAWRDVVRGDPDGVTHVIPVGSLGNRLTNPAYIPGKSDKDMIPMGPRATESVEKFRRAFTSRFGLPPEKLDINVLDPTNPSEWPGRVEAVANPEKYNTVGGNNWLQRDTYTRNPTVWKLDPTTGKIQESTFQSLFPKETKPAPLTTRDAAGFFSDNTRFRNELARKYNDPAELILKQSKYDLRNAAAYGLAGGKFTREEQALMEAASLARNGKLDEAVRRYAAAIGADASTEAGKQAAMKAYLEGMNSLTEKIGKTVVATHLDEIAKAGKNSKTLIAELGGVLNNLPPNVRENIVKELSNDVGRANTLRLADQVANTLAKNVFIKKAFDEAAQKLFGKPYEQLTPAEKLLVHNAGEESASSLSKFGKGAGVTLTAAAILISMQQAYASESATRGTAIGVSAGIGRGMLDLIQLGYPPLIAAELAGRAAALGVSFGIDSYKMDVLDKLYEQYKRTGNLDDVLSDAEFQKYFPGGLRVFRNELREAAAREGKTLTEEQLDRAIRDYFFNRAEIDKQQKKIEHDLAWAKAFVTNRRIPLVLGSDSDVDNAQLSEAEMEQALAGLLLRKLQFEQMLRADGVPFTKQDILSLLFITYRGTPDELAAALNQLYRNVGKSYPPGAKRSQKPKGTTQLTDGKTSAPKQLDKNAVKILHARNATVVRGPKSQQGCSPGLLLGGGGSFPEKRVDTPCDPPISLGSTEVSCGGELLVVLDVDKPVNSGWVWNSDTAVRVHYQARISGKLGQDERLGVASGSPPDGDCSITLTLPGPGKLSAYAEPPRGAGPLTTQCLGQGFNARIEMVKPFNELPALQENQLLPGDKIRTDAHPWSQAVLTTQQGERVIVSGGGNQVRLAETGRQSQQLVVESGYYGSTIRYARPKSAASKRVAEPLTIREGAHSLRPSGTDFLVAHLGVTTTVAVLEGRVDIEGDDGFTTTVAEGTRFNLQDRGGSPLTPREKNDALTMDGFPPGNLPDTPADLPSMDVGAYVDGSKIEPGWFVLDKDADAKVSAEESSDTLRFVVPPGNELNRREVSLPLLLHAVTGDFDLEGEVDVNTTATDNAMALLVAYQPGAYLGFHTEQRDAEWYAAHFVSFGGLQLVDKVWELTTFEGEIRRPNFETSPSAVRLKLTRRGHLWKSYASVDHGITWHLTRRMIIDAQPTLYVGWGFQRAAYDLLAEVPAEFKLRRVRLVSGDASSLSQQEWDTNALTGAASASEEGLIATALADQKGASRVETASPLPGDFDLCAEYEILAWRNARYETTNFCFYIADVAHQNFAYIGRSAPPNEPDRFHTDLRQDGTWGRGYQWLENAEKKGMIRIRRVGKEISTYFWDRDHWERLDKGFNGGWDSPVFAGLLVANEGDQGLPGNATVRLHLVDAKQEEKVAEVPPPSSDEVTIVPAPSPLASDVQVPAGWDVAAVELPFESSTIFPAKEGGIYVVSNDRRYARLAHVAHNLQVTDALTTDLFAGINRKAGLERTERFWLLIDGWWEGGNRYSGLYQVDRRGAWFRRIESVELGDLSAMMGIGDKVLFLADFGRGGIYAYYPAEDKMTALLEGSPELRGVVSLAYDSKRDLLLAATAKSHGAEQSALCRMDLRQKPVQPRKVFLAGRESEDFVGVVWDNTTQDRDNVLVAVTAENSIWRVSLSTAKAEVVVRGIPTIAALRWSGNALWAMCTPRTLIRLTPPQISIAQSETAGVPPQDVAVGKPTSLPTQPEAPSGGRRDGVTQASPTSERPREPEPARKTPAAPPPSEPKEFVFHSPKESVRLLDSYPTSDFMLGFSLSWTKSGSVFDTIGIDAAPTGSWSVNVEPTGYLTFGVYAPKVSSAVRASNGWHVLRTAKTLSRERPVQVRIIHLPSATTQIYLENELVAEERIPAPLSGKPVYLGDYAPDAHWAPRYPTERGFVGRLKIYYLGKSVRQTDAPPVRKTPYVEPVGSFGGKAQPPASGIDLRAFAGLWQIVAEGEPSKEKEFIVLRVVDGKVMGKGGTQEDLLEFDKFEQNQLRGRVVPSKGTDALPVMASLNSDGTVLTLKIAPPASEFVIVRAIKVRDAAEKAEQRKKLQQELKEAQELYRLAIEKGTDEELKEAKRAVDEIERQLQRLRE
ncbi:MAG: hypothetical protein ACPL7D_00020 [Candidatus Sumerlaeaceae bacterium]